MRAVGHEEEGDERLIEDFGECGLREGGAAHSREECVCGGRVCEKEEGGGLRCVYRSRNLW